MLLFAGLGNKRTVFLVTLLTLLGVAKLILYIASFLLMVAFIQNVSVQVVPGTLIIKQMVYCPAAAYVCAGY